MNRSSAGTLPAGRIRSRLSIAIGLIDSYTADAPTDSSLTVRLEQISNKPYKKDNGYYLFTDLPRGSYTAVVESAFYSVCRMEVASGETLVLQDGVFYASLKPRPSYPFNDGATVIRMRLLDCDGRAVAGATVRGTILSEECARGRLSREAGQGDSVDICVANLSGKVAIGDMFLLRSRTGNEFEQCRISSASTENRCYRLEKPLGQLYDRGALLLPTIEATSDESGEVVVPFRGISTKAFDVHLDVMRDDERIGEVKEVTVRAGMTNDLGGISVLLIT